MLKKIAAILIFFLSGFAFVWAQTPSEAQLSRIEKTIWGFSYDDESEISRIERAEKQIFGAANPKITPEKRIDKLTKSLGIETLEEAKSSLSELYVPEKAGQGAEYPQIDRLESNILGNMYKNENIYSRLERLEKKVFGAKQEGDLAGRTEALNRSANISGNVMQSAQNTNYEQVQKPYNPYDYPQTNEDVKLQLAALENMIFATDFSQEPVELRLNRLENKIFQRNFDDDDSRTRISRIQAAATANKTAKYYDNNKFQKYAATGLQAASFILMILAFIL
ncbi:MAG: hypothetical protein LUE64_05560 [Candidatus Gastranaerophilales bacterium]|nr:hypothetical protein [Candidatus Gastranaerophilales bacterium]